MINFQNTKKTFPRQQYWEVERAPAFILNSAQLSLPSSGFTQNKSIIYRNSALADKLLYSTNLLGQYWLNKTFIYRNSALAGQMSIVHLYSISTDPVGQYWLKKKTLGGFPNFFSYFR